MATSGSVDFSVSRDNLIGDALTQVGAVAPNETPAAAQVTHASRLLNMIAKAWQSYGISLWARKTGYIFPQTSTFAIDLGPSGDHAALTYTHTNVTTAASGGASTIELDSVTGVANGYNIGIETEEGIMEWFTVNGAPAGSVVTLSANLSNDVAAGADVYVYIAKIMRPLRVVDAYLKIQETGVETPLAVLSKAEWDLVSNKDEPGVPNQVMYDPQLVDGTFYVNPQFENGDRVIRIVFQRPFEDFDAASDTPDFPQEWYMALMFALAAALAPSYGVPVNDRKMLSMEAKQWLALALANEPEEGSLKLQPDMENA